MLFTFNFDFNNEKHIMALRELEKLGIVPTSNNVSVSDTHEDVNTPVKKAKVYADATDVQCKWVQDSTHVTYTLENGKYVGQSSVRKALNKRLRDVSTWDGEKKVWVFTTKAKAEKFCKEVSALVTADEINDVRARAQARAEKKANKNA